MFCGVYPEKSVAIVQLQPHNWRNRLEASTNNSLGFPWTVLFTHGLEIFVTSQTPVGYGR